MGSSSSSLTLGDMHRVAHVTQQYNWDCGLACVAMVIQNDDSRSEFLSNLPNLLVTEDLETSIWTIDLAYILKHLSIDFSYYTAILGINQVFKNEPYYTNVLDVDRLRVTRKFEEADLKNVNVSKRILTLKEILDYLKKYPIILLLDAHRFQCRNPNHGHVLANLALNPFCYCCKFFKKTSYHGHYVVLIGYDHDKKVIYYNDPSLNEECCQMTCEEFETSRKARGTDEDIIIIKGFTTS